MGARGDTCICKRLIGLGIVDALGGDPRNARFLTAIRSCMQRSACPPFELTPVGSDGGRLPERRGGDRRSGRDRRQNAQPWPADKERRDGRERRSGGDRRGLTRGQAYTQEQTFLNLQAWCADKCRGAYRLWIDPNKGGGLRFRFELASDRDRFLEMLRDYQKPGT